MRKTSLSGKWCWKRWTAACKWKKLQYVFTQYIKINSKCLKDLIIRHDTIKLLEEIIDKTFPDTNRTNIFLGQALKVIGMKGIKRKINKWDLIKLTRFCTAKETIGEKKKKIYRMGKNICEWCDWQWLNLQNIQIVQLNNKKTNNWKMDRT